MKNRKKIAKAAAGILTCAILVTGCGAGNGGQQTEAEKTEAETQTMTLANPWVSCTAEEAAGICDNLFVVPEGASDVNWLKLTTVNPGEKELVQVTFTLDGISYTARAQQGLNGDSDISGYYYEWTSKDESNFSLYQWDLPAKEYRFVGEEGSIDLLTWYDADKKIVYALSATGADLEGFDITAIAGQMRYHE